MCIICYFLAEQGEATRTKSETHVVDNNFTETTGKMQSESPVNTENLRTKVIAEVTTPAHNLTDSTGSDHGEQNQPHNGSSSPDGYTMEPFQPINGQDEEDYYSCEDQLLLHDKTNVTLTEQQGKEIYICAVQ